MNLFKLGMKVNGLVVVQANEIKENVQATGEILAILKKTLVVQTVNVGNVVMRKSDVMIVETSEGG